MKLRNEVLEIRKEAKQKFALAPFSVEEKGNLSNLVTSNDKRIQEFLIDKLSSLLPGCGFFCEENHVLSIDGKENIFIIDPIDGTRNYTRKNPICAISVALEQKGRVALGIVLPLFTDEVYFAERGQGAYYNGTRISVSDRDFKNGIVRTSFSSYDRSLSPICFETARKIFPQVNDLRRYGACSVELCKLAKGEEDRFFELTLNPWDYAAAGLVLEEAGGCLTGRNRNPLDYRKKTLVIAANKKENREKLSSIVSSVLDEHQYQR